MGMACYLSFRRRILLPHFLKQFSLINFLYGLGAAIILLAALFRFLGFWWSDYLFMVGIIGEAIIFVVSGAMPVAQNKQYNWENVFPQLQKEEELGLPKTDENMTVEQGSEMLGQAVQNVGQINRSIEQLNETTIKLIEAVEKLESNYEKVNNSTLEYEREINALKIKIAAANERLKDFEKFKF
jgi:gliding motility-associated protein GldL